MEGGSALVVAVLSIIRLVAAAPVPEAQPSNWHNEVFVQVLRN